MLLLMTLPKTNIAPENQRLVGSDDSFPSGGPLPIFTGQNWLLVSGAMYSINFTQGEVFFFPMFSR